jgi:hypothetical protein
LSPDIIRGHLPLPSPGFHPVGWLGALLLSFVSMLSHSFRLLGVLRGSSSY